MQLPLTPHPSASPHPAKSSPPAGPAPPKLSAHKAGQPKPRRNQVGGSLFSAEDRAGYMLFTNALLRRGLELELRA
jgi:hypothetical protein